MNNNKLKCSPYSTKTDNSCLNLNSLKKIAIKINNNSKYKKFNKINYNNINKKKILLEIKKRLNCKLTIDKCILNNDNIFDKEFKEFFKPVGPKGKNEWLSTLDIKKVMNQYEKKYKDFIFFGPVPIDFDDIFSEISKINLKNLFKNKKKLGFIFNTDPHYKSGEHWISLFVDLNNKTICYFDSVGHEPPKEISNLINKLINQAKKININLKIINNTTQHQFQDSECGVYSIYFLVSRLKGKSCEYINKLIVKDKVINKFRKIFFNDLHKNLL